MAIGRQRFVARAFRAEKVARYSVGGIPGGGGKTDRARRTRTASVSKVRSQPVEFLEFIEDDLRYARAYYDSWKTDGADWFQGRLREAISWIEWNPEMFPKQYRSFRRTIIRQTYFGIFFAIEPEVTTVVAVLDLRQDPKGIRLALRARA